MRPTIIKLAVPALAMGVLLALPGCHYHHRYGYHGYHGYHGHHAGHGHNSSQDSDSRKKADVRKKERRQDRREGRY
ncbi:MAG: hypothetical protein QNJ67_00510 [Kiloniellales bacterium]|nr:hypothetical protein [Kiloniellales bacterium]